MKDINLKINVQTRKSEQKEGFLQQHIYEMADLVLKTSFVHQRKLSAKMKHQFSKAATS
jgi:RNase adaptor protein for sRNA GlmZ degradation